MPPASPHRHSAVAARLAIGAFLSVVAPARLVAQPPELPTVAVMPLQAKGVSANEADVMTDAMASRLQQTGRMRVLERSQMDQILKEQGFATSGACDGSECELQMGKLLSVDRMVVGSAGLVGHTYTLNIRLVSVSTGEVLRSSLKSRSGTIDDVLTSLVPEAVEDITEVARPAGDTAKSKAPAKTASGSHWIWWTAGGAALAGGVAAAVVLLKPQPADNPTPIASNPTTTSLTAKW